MPSNGLLLKVLLACSIRKRPPRTDFRTAVPSLTIGSPGPIQDFIETFQLPAIFISWACSGPGAPIFSIMSIICLVCSSMAGIPAGAFPLAGGLSAAKAARDSKSPAHKIAGQSRVEPENLRTVIAFLHGEFGELK